MTPQEAERNRRTRNLFKAIDRFVTAKIDQGSSAEAYVELDRAEQSLKAAIDEINPLSFTISL